MIKGFAKQYVADGFERIDPLSFLAKVKPEVQNVLSKNRMHKINLVLDCEMERVDMKSGEVITTIAPFLSKTELVLESTDISNLYNRASDKICASISAYQMLGSNWRISSVRSLTINTINYKPLKGKSYIPLPDKLSAKKAIINMKNDDDQCFKWCITRALNPAENHPERITQKLREQAEKLDWSGISFPVAVSEHIISKVKETTT